MIDIVFSIDSIITAVGMTEYFPIMVIAVVVAVGVMMVAVGPLAAFIHRNPTVLMLALSFLLMIGMTLIADGFGFHIERGYIYAAMFFSSRGRDAQRPGERTADRRATDMTLSSLILFAAVYFAAVATPGPGVAALIARVLGQGLRGVAPFIAGYFVGDMIWLTFAATGLAVIAKTFAGVFVAIKFAGAAYLLYLAWRMATAPAVVEAAPRRPRGAGAPSSARCR